MSGRLTALDADGPAAEACVEVRYLEEIGARFVLELAGASGARVRIRCCSDTITSWLEFRILQRRPNMREITLRLSVPDILLVWCAFGIYVADPDTAMTLTPGQADEIERRMLHLKHHGHWR